MAIVGLNPVFGNSLWSGEYRAEPGEGGEGALNYSS